MDNLNHPKTISNYRVQGVIGQGGMGVVYLAEDERLQRQVAIKCINEHIADDVLTERLRHEAQWLAQLNHPNVVQVYDFIDDGKNLALVMEYVEGRTLRQYLKENLCDQKQKLLFLAQIADGLAAAHNAGIVHRDLKLDNILVNQQGLLKLTDFGIAKSQDPSMTDLTQHDAVSGSYSAMSPEQIRGEKVGPASDIFAFGILAWRILLGRHPFGDEAGQLIMVEKILNNTPQSLASTDVDLPLELCQLIDSLLIKDPKQRPSSAPWLARQLQVLLPEVSDELSGELTAHNILRTDFNIPAYHPNYWSRLAKVFSLATFLGLLGFVGIKFKPHDYLFSEPVQHIAILEPELKGEDKDSFLSLKSSLFLALQDGVRGLENKELVSPQEVSSARRSGGKIGDAVGADLVITSQLNCQKKRCQLTLSEMGGARWAVLKQDRLTLINEKLLTIHEQGQQAVQKLLGAKQVTDSLSEVVSEADFQLYLKLRKSLTNSFQELDTLLIQLESIQRRAPRFSLLYDLYVKLGLDAYEKSGSKNYLERIKLLLDKAPISINQSIEFHSLEFKVYLSEMEYNKALGSVELMEKLGLDSWVSERMRAQVALAMGKQNEAVTLFEDRLKERRSSQAYRDLAKAYWKVGNKEDALAKVKASLKLSPESMKSHSLMASIALSSGDLKSATSTYLKLLPKHPVVGVYESLGLLALLERDFSSAVEYFTHAKNLKPKERLFSLYLGDSYFFAGQKNEAATYYRQLSELAVAKESAAEHSYLARALIQQGDTMNAMRVLQKAQTLGSNNKSVAFASALSYSKVGNYASSLLWIETALDLGVEKNWFALPWFDKLCESTEYSQAFEKSSGLKCPLTIHSNS